MDNTEPTFRGFKRSDLGYDPAFDVPRTRELNIENPQPDPGILAEYRYLFVAGGYVERSMAVDAIGGHIRGGAAAQQLALAARRYLCGVPLPSIAASTAAMKDAYHNKYTEGWKP